MYPSQSDGQVEARSVNDEGNVFGLEVFGDASCELELHGVAYARDTRGFRQVLIYGGLEKPFEAYCQLAGTKVARI